MADEKTEAVFRLAIGFRVTGVVKGPDGKPVPGVSLVARTILPSLGRPPDRPERRLFGRGPWQGQVDSGARRGLAALDRRAMVVDAPSTGVVFVLKKRELADLTAGEGIEWRGGVQRTMARARQDNLPVLVAVNAWTTRAAIWPWRRCATGPRGWWRRRAISCAWSARPTIIRARTSARASGPCTCANHKEVINWVMLRYARGNLISPSHWILAPDGTVLWQQDYWIDVDPLRRAIERAIVKTSPRRALEMAAGTRDAETEAIQAGGAGPEELRQVEGSAGGGGAAGPGGRTTTTPGAGSAQVGAEGGFGMVRLFLEDEDKLLRGRQGDRCEAWRLVGALPFQVEGQGAAAQGPKLAAAYERLAKGDKSVLDILLAALGHPVDGPEVRAALAALAGTDLGNDPEA